MPHKIAYDVKLMRPGCVLLQAAFRCDSQVAHAFDPQDWLLAPTPDLKVYPLRDDAQLKQLVEMTRQKRENPHG